jgi:hypothetical protein
MNEKIKYVIYSHTSYLDVLRVQSDYATKYGPAILCINSNNLDISDIYEKYDNVVFYDDTVQYAERLVHCLNQIDDEYFLFMHDIDILLWANQDVINKFYRLMLINGIDRIDLKRTNTLDQPNLIEIDFNIESNGWITKPVGEIGDGDYMIKQENPKEFIYNVNPSIWKKSTLLDIMVNFKHKSYRNIEDLDVQNFSTKLNVYKLYSKKYLMCGYFNCLELFKFLHISHNGTLLSLNDSFTTMYGQQYSDVKDEYIKIINNYNIKI